VLPTRVRITCSPLLPSGPEATLWGWGRWCGRQGGGRGGCGGWRRGGGNDVCGVAPSGESKEDGSEAGGRKAINDSWWQMMLMDVV
jgi:hypothetical protein